MPPVTFQLIAALLAILLFAGPLPAESRADGWRSTPIASSHANDQKCKRVVFIGARGSGEDPTQSRTLKAIRDQISEQPGVPKDVRQVYIDYPAAEIDSSVLQDIKTLLLDDDLTKIGFWDSTEKGVEETRRYLLDNVQRCPNEKIVMVGFSQGAEAVNRGLNLALKESPQVGENLVAAVLLGNPGNFSGQDVEILDGNSNEGSGGLSTTLRFLRARAKDGPAGRFEQIQAIIEAIFDLYEQRVPKEELQPVMAEMSFDIPEPLRGKIYSVCNDGDMICDSVPALTRILSAQTSVNTELERSEPQHLSYPDTATNTVEAVGKALAELGKTNKDPKPGTESQPSDDPAADSAWLFGAGAALLAVIAAAVGIGRARKKR